VRALRPPVARLPDTERQRLGGLIFYGAVHFVDRVSQILRERPTLSPDPARIHAAGLAGRQRRATCWAMVHGVLSELAELANDCFLHEQGLAIEEAQEVIERYDLILAQGLLQGETHGLLEDALQIARPKVLLSRTQKRQRQARQRGERRIREARRRIRSGAAPPSSSTKAAGRRRRQAVAAPAMDLLAWGRRPSP
jgi:hypothetical protein